jgi:serine/threonine protein kinase
MIGRMLKHYRIEEELGKGGMGVVYRALDTRLDRPVALKLLPAQFTEDPERRARFLREARAACAVNHPAIAQVYDADEADGVAFIAMELVEGKTLLQLVRLRELDVLGAVEIAIQVAEGLAKAHSAGIIHRDIKSENIMVTPEGHAKILDFGLAKLDDYTPQDDADPAATMRRTVAATSEGLVIGTIGYMSPEQARGRSLDARSDLFSLGTVIYEMVTGELPFKGDSPLDTLHAIAFEETRPVTSIRVNVPVSLHRVVTKCLRKRPEDRHPSAEALVDELRQVLRDLDSGISRRLPLVERVRAGLESWQEGAGPKWLLPIGVLGLVLLLFVLLFSGREMLPALFFFALLALLLYRRFRNQPLRVLNRFAKKAAKLEEVLFVTLQGAQVLVLVREPKAKTYVHLNSLMAQANGKLFFGRRYELSIRESLPDAELKRLIESPGVLYVSEELAVPSKA